MNNPNNLRTTLGLVIYASIAIIIVPFLDASLLVKFLTFLVSLHIFLIHMAIEEVRVELHKNTEEKQKTGG